MQNNTTGVTKMLKGIIRLSLAAFALVIGMNVYAASIDQDTAKLFATSWLSSQGNPVVADGAAREIAAAIPVEAEGFTYAYAVNFAPKGYMVVASDDRVSPVLFYSADGAFVNDTSFPLYSLVILDMKARLAAADAEAPEAEVRAGAELPEYYKENRDEWKRYLSDDTRAWGVATIEDIWVEPFTKTLWSQSTITDATTGVTSACYNYYTPTPTPEGPVFEEGNTANAVSGCTATTVAQIVRYFEWPQVRLPNMSNDVTVGADDNMMKKAYPLTLKLMGGDGKGGAYDWSLMTYAPGVAKTDAAYQEYNQSNIKMIGRLLRDAGVANGMHYYGNNNGESAGNVSPNSFTFFDMKATSGGNGFVAIRSNLDARRPVPVSISPAIPKENGSGHSIYTDGYGTHNGRWFYHMNFGWGGGSNGWYNFDEHFAATWSKSISVDAANIYRNEILQDNESISGSILSGRVTDANGTPVAGVKVSIRKAGETDTFMTMLAWYDRNDGIDCHTAVKSGEAGYGAEFYRNCTDAKGIWAIDKVPLGNYEIVLEKDGYDFIGTATVSTTGGTNDKWGLNFVAVPEEVGKLEFLGYYLDENSNACLVFNRPIGGVKIDPSKIHGDTPSGQDTFEGMTFKYSPDSNIIVVNSSYIDLISDGFLYYDVDGYASRDDIYNVPVVSALAKIDSVQKIEYLPVCSVTGITRNGAPEVSTSDTLTFAVTATGDVDVNDFKVAVQDGLEGIALPVASIESYESGILTVNVTKGYGIVRVDYIPADGDAYVNGESYLVDTAAPAILKAEILDIDTVQYVNLTFNEPIVGAGNAPVTPNDFTIILYRNGGSVQGVTIDEVANFDGSAITGPAANIRCRLAFTPAMTDKSLAPVPSGVERIEIRPYAESIYDVNGNVAPESISSGELPLSAIGGLRVCAAELGPDNTSIALRFTKRIVGNDGTGFGENFIPNAAANLKKIVDDEKSTIDADNFEVYAIYDDDSEELLTLTPGVTGKPKNSIFHTEGSNYVVINLLGENIDENLAKLNPADKTLKSVRVILNNIYSYQAEELLDPEVTLEAKRAYNPGYAGLMPPMFTNKKGSYTFIHAPGCEDGNPTWINSINYTQVTTGDYSFGQAPYVWTMLQSGDSPRFAFQHDSVDATEEDGVEDGEMTFGMYYRDLDGDGRVDAVDMNFFNPWGHDTKNPAHLVAGANAADNFIVWVHSDDYENIINTIEDEGNWGVFPTLGDYPLDTYAKATSLYNFNQNFKGWKKANVTGVEVVQQNANHTMGNGPIFKDNSNYVYSTLRVHFDQTNVSPRTYGDRVVFVAYKSPVSTIDGVANLNYNKLLTDGLNSSPLDPGAEYTYKQGDTEIAKFGKNSVNTHTKNKTYSNADEQDGIYWVREVSSETDYGALNAVWVCDSFGPVMAWDGVAPRAVSAFAWRATPYVKPEGGDSLDALEFVDVRFSEPILAAGDRTLCLGDTRISGFGSSEDDYADLINGGIGATLINEYTVRYRIAKAEHHPNNNFKIKGVLYPVSGALEQAWSTSTPFGTHAEIEFNAPYVTPINTAYRVLGASSDTVDVFKFTAGGTITNNVSAPTYDGGAEPTYTFNAGTQQTLTAEPVSSAIVDADSINLTTYTGYSMRDQGGAFANGDVRLYLDDNEGKFKVNATDTSSHPGAAFYAALNNVTVINAEYQTWETNGATKWARPNCATTQFFGNFGAPSAASYVTSSYSTPETPNNSLLSGPLYVYGKAMADEKSYTSRVNVGETLTVMGIDVAAPAAYKLTGVKVRIVDTSNGSFDPAIALKPLADDNTSGVLLYNKATASVVQLSTDGLSWSPWKKTVEGLLYREVTLKPLGGVAIPASGNNANSTDFEIRVVPSSEFKFGDSFYAQIPDDGLFIGAYQSTDSVADTWGTPNGTKGYRLTDARYRNINNDGRWTAGEPIVICEDTAQQYTWKPFIDGGIFMDANRASHSQIDLQENGINTREIFYAKKNGALNPETTPWNGLFGISSVGGYSASGSAYDLEYNVSYVPGDDAWYEVGGTFGVYDEGIDIPIVGNADLFALPYAVQEFGARGAQFHATAPAAVADVSTGNISAPNQEATPILAVNMQDNSRAFGPKFILDGAILVDVISKDLASGEHTLVFDAAANTLTFDGGAAVAVPATVGARAIASNADKNGFVVLRRLNDVSKSGTDEFDAATAKALPADNQNVTINVGAESAREIQQPAAITGVRVLAVGNGVNVAQGTLTRTGAKLAWNGGAAVNASEPGTYVLYDGAKKSENAYIVVCTTALGGASSEKLNVYPANGRQSTPLAKITGLEIMAVGDMISQGWYNVSYDAGAVAFGNGGSTKVPAVGDVAIVYGDGTAEDYSRPFIVVKRTAESLPTAAVTDSIFVNQNQLFWVDVTIRSVSGVTPSHFNELSTSVDSGISLWWDADASGSYSAGDMFVPLAQKPVFEGGGDVWTCSLIPDQDFITAWLSTPLDGSFDSTSNFFICVKTTEDMSYGDAFQMSASFLEPSEPNYNYNDYRRDPNAAVEFGTNRTGRANQLTRGNVFSYAEVVSKTNTCTTVTNTVFAKTTTVGQSIDADTIVPLTSVKHFVLTNDAKNLPYVTKVSLDLVNVANFNPAVALKPIDNATPAAQRGVILYKDNGDGVFSTADTVVNTTIVATTDAGITSYTLLVADETCVLPTSNTGKADLFLAVNFSEELPYGVQFYGHMDADYITYTSGKGSGASAIDTDVLTSTINSEYADILTAEPYSTMGGLLVRSVGKNVSGYQTVTLKKSINGSIVLAWNGNEAVIDKFWGTTTVTLGSGDNSITVTLDLERFFSEDILVYSTYGEPLVEMEVEEEGTLVTKLLPVERGAKLVSLAGSTTCFYDDNDMDGKFSYATDKINPAGTTAITAKDNLAFFDANEDGEWTADEPIFFDTDRAYTLPWMDLVIDRDSINTPGAGDKAVALNSNGDLEAIDEALSPAAGAEVVNGNTYLYYIDMDGDANRNFNFITDVIIARVAEADTMSALTLGASDSVVLYMDYQNFEGAISDYYGTPLRQFTTGDYLAMNLDAETAGRYTMSKALILSNDETWQDIDVSWDFLATPNRVVRRITPDNANADFATPESAMSAIIGLDIANSGASDVALTSLTVNFQNVSGWANTDFCTLTADTASGVQLWKDADGNGAFDPYVDAFVPLAGAPAWSQNGNIQLVTLAPAANNAITSETVDGIFDYFVVIIPSVTANNSIETNDGDKFVAYINNSDVSLNKTLNKTASVTTGTITVDSLAPKAISVAVTAGEDGIATALTITFDETLKRMPENSDLSVWSVVDSFTGNAYKVTAFNLNDKVATLTLAPADGLTAADYSTAPVKVSAAFTFEAAPVDLAGNPAEIEDTLAEDVASPNIVSIGFYDKASKEGYADTLVVKFSEPIVDETFGATAWTVDGIAMNRTEPGSTCRGITDKLNDEYLFFTVATTEPTDVDAVTFDFGTKQTLADPSGNVLVIGEFARIDGIKPVIETADHYEGFLAISGDDCTIPAGTVLKLTFSEEIEIGTTVSGMTLDFGSGYTFDLNGDGTDTELLADGDSILVTFVNNITVDKTLVENAKIVIDAACTGLSDVDSNPVAAGEVPLYLCVEPVLVAPVAGVFYSADGEPVIVPQIDLNYLAEKGTNWSIEIYEMDDTGAATGDALVNVSGTAEYLSAIDDDPADNVELSGWYNEAKLGYVFKATVKNNRAADEVFTAGFYAFNVYKTAMVDDNTAVTIERTGAPSYHEATYDDGDTHYMLLDGAYTSGNVNVDGSQFAEFLKVAPAYNVKVSCVNNKGIDMSATDVTTLAWSDETSETKLVSGDVVYGKAEYCAIDVNGDEVILASAISTAYVLKPNFDVITASVTLTDGAYNELTAEPIVWNDNTALYAVISQNDVEEYQWRVVPNDGSEKQPWSLASDMNQGRTRFGWAKVSENEILVAGGYKGDTTGLDNAEIYNAVTGTWSTTASLNTAAYDNAVVALGDGTALAIAGQNNIYTLVDTVELYKDGAWTVAANLSQPKSRVAAVRKDNKIYVVGGYASGATYLQEIEILTIADGKVTAEVSSASLVNGRGNAQVFVQGDRLVVVGGTPAGKPAESIVINADGSLGAVSEQTGLASISGMAFVQDDNGTIWAIGGIGSNKTYSLATGADEWLEGPDTIAVHVNGAALCMGDEIVLVAGNDTASSETLAYDEVGATWKENADLATAADGNRKNFALTTINGTAYAFGGQISSALTTSTESRVASWTSWIAANPSLSENEIAITGLNLTVGDGYILQVRTRNSFNEISDKLLTKEFTIGDGSTGTEAVATINASVNGFDVLSGATTALTEIDFAFVGDANTVSYKYSLDGASIVATDDAALALSALADGAHSILLYAVSADGTVQTTPTEFTWTVAPISLTSDAVTEGGITALSNGLAFSVAPDAWTTYRYAVDSDVLPTSGDAAISEAIELSELTPGAHTLKVWTATAIDDWNDDNSAIFTFVVVGLSVDPTEIETSDDAAENYFYITLNAEGGEVAKYQWHFDDDESTLVDPADAVLTVGKPAPGAHTLYVAAVDAAGNVQSVPAQVNFLVKSVAGDQRFIAVINGDPTAAYTKNALVKFTLSFEDNDGVAVAPLAGPVDSDFTVAGGSITNVADNGDGTYTVSVKPNAVTYPNTSTVSLQLNAGVCYEGEYGHKNLASNVAKTEIYKTSSFKRMVNFAVKFFSDEELTMPITSVELNDTFYAAIQVTTSKGFTGGDVKMTFTNTYMQMISDFDLTKIVQAPYNGKSDDGKSFTTGELIKNDKGKVKGARIGGAILPGETAKTGTFNLAVFKFKAIKESPEKLAYFTLAAGKNTIGLEDMEPLANDDESIYYGGNTSIKITTPADRLMAFGVQIFSDENLTNDITGGSVTVGDTFYVRVIGTTAPGKKFISGDFNLTYNSNKFAPVGTFDAATAVKEPYKATGNVVTSTNAYKKGFYMNVSAPSDILAQTGTIPLAVFTFKAIKTGAVDEKDFTTSLIKGTQPIMMVGMESVAASNSAIGHDDAQLAVAGATVNISLDDISYQYDGVDYITEGATFKVVATLDNALAEDLTVTVNATDELGLGIVSQQTIVIPANDTTASVDVTIPNDGKITGDYGISFAIDSVSPAALKVAAGDACEAKIVDLDLAGDALVCTILNDADEEVNYVVEGETFYLNVEVPAGVTVVNDVVVSLALEGDSEPAGTAEPSVDFTYENTLTIKAGETSAKVAFNTYADGVKGGASKTVKIFIPKCEAGASEWSAFADNKVAEVYIIDGDTLAADFNNDGFLDLDDVMIFVSFYQTEDDGSDGWASCDLNNDGVIDLDDVMLFVYYYNSEEVREAIRGAIPEFSFSMEIDKDGAVAVGDVINLSMFMNYDSGSFNGGYATISWNPEQLTVVGPFKDGAFDKDAALDATTFSTPLATNGVLDNEGGSLTQFGGALLSPALSGKVCIGTIQMKVLAEGAITVKFDGFSGTAPKATIANDTATGKGDDLTFTVGGKKAGFELDIHAAWSAVRAVSDVALSLGEKEGASDAFDAKDGDTKTSDASIPYALYIANGSDVLSRDYRAISEEEVTWNVTYKSMSATDEVTLTWDASTIADYNLFIVEKGGNRIDMKETTSYVLSGTQVDFAIAAAPVADAKDEFKYSLEAGWNLLSAPFALDAKAIEALLGEDTEAAIYEFDAEGSFVVSSAEAFAAGTGFWVYRSVAEEVTVEGLIAENPAGVQVKADEFALCGPLANTAELVLPPSAQVWIWTSEGYRWIDADEDIVPGRGYWFLSEVDDTIWAPAEDKE